MKVFKELTINVTGEKLDEFLSQVESRLANGWERDHEAEERFQNSGFAGDLKHCYFSCDKRDDRESAMLALVQKENGALQVTNIIPTDLHRLDIVEYNHIIDDFYSLCIQPVSFALGISCTLTGDEVTLEDWISTETGKLLRLFSHAANKSSGSAHPMDQERWNDFLLGIYQSGDKLEVHQLERWLVEEGGWHPDVAGELAEEYEFAMGLLRQQESRQAS